MSILFQLHNLIISPFENDKNMSVLNSVFCDGYDRLQSVRLGPDLNLSDVDDEGGHVVDPRVSECVQEGPVLEVDPDAALLDLMDRAEYHGGHEGHKDN